MQEKKKGGGEGGDRNIAKHSGIQTMTFQKANTNV